MRLTLTPAMCQSFVDKGCLLLTELSPIQQVYIRAEASPPSQLSAQPTACSSTELLSLLGFSNEQELTISGSEAQLSLYMDHAINKYTRAVLEEKIRGLQSC